MTQTQLLTDRQNRADLEQLWDHVLDSQNADTSRKYLKKLSPKPSLNPAKIPVKEHLRLASVVALSSNGACGAIILTNKHCLEQVHLGGNKFSMFHSRTIVISGEQ